MRLIFERPGVDRTALSTAVKRTNAAISNIVNELIQANLIVEGQATHAVVQPGRRRVGLKIHPPGGYVLGVSAIATNSSIVLADIGGQRIKKSNLFQTGSTTLSKPWSKFTTFRAMF